MKLKSEVPVDTSTPIRAEGIDTEKLPFEQKFQDCAETNNILNEKDIKNMDEESSKTVENLSNNTQSTSGIQKFFYFYQGSYVLIFLCFYLA